ncbi:MAG: hypothetical protein SPJ62_15695 [Inconstantimicrobium porci]|uniref:hypothetical protein n=1 Tax=Inconstantimicrobium porci TaxID=2652291 RepID=UPI002A918CF0|nr:hypothetical protein [Inconstantimicrobium porci]MDY5913411.1 hypothetical protein [Inconstantimicrobium porci]
MDKYNIGTMSFKKDGKIYTLDIDSIKRQFKQYFTGDSSVFAIKDQQNIFTKNQKITTDSNGNISSTSYSSNGLYSDGNYNLSATHLTRSALSANAPDNEIPTMKEVRSVQNTLNSSNIDIANLKNSIKIVSAVPATLEPNSLYVQVE